MHIVVSKQVGPSIELYIFFVIYNAYIYHGLRIYGVYATGMCASLQNLFLWLCRINYRIV